MRAIDATTPFGMAVVFIPESMQLNEPFAPKQARNLPAFVALALAVILVAAKSVAE